IPPALAIAVTSVRATSFILVHSERVGTSPARRSILPAIDCDEVWGEKKPGRLKSGLENKPFAPRASLLGHAGEVRVVQAGERLVAHLLEQRALVGRNRLAALALEGKLGVVRDAVD